MGRIWSIRSHLAPAIARCYTMLLSSYKMHVPPQILFRLPARSCSRLSATGGAGGGSSTTDLVLGISQVSLQLFSHRGGAGGRRFHHRSSSGYQPGLVPAIRVYHWASWISVVKKTQKNEGGRTGKPCGSFFGEGQSCWKKRKKVRAVERENHAGFFF